MFSEVQQPPSRPSLFHPDVGERLSSVIHPSHLTCIMHAPPFHSYRHQSWWEFQQANFGSSAISGVPKHTISRKLVNLTCDSTGESVPATSEKATAARDARAGGTRNINQTHSIYHAALLNLLVAPSSPIPPRCNLASPLSMLLTVLTKIGWKELDTQAPVGPGVADLVRALAYPRQLHGNGRERAGPSLPTPWDRC
jgi:hypothetical protein